MGFRVWHSHESNFSRKRSRYPAVRWVFQNNTNIYQGPMNKNHRRDLGKCRSTWIKCTQLIYCIACLTIGLPDHGATPEVANCSMPPQVSPWWRHKMEAFSALLALCAGNSPVTGEFPSQRPVTGSFDVFFDLCLNKQLSKQSWCWWFETPSPSLWC